MEPVAPGSTRPAAGTGSEIAAAVIKAATTTRGRPPSRLLGIRTAIPSGWRIGLGLAGVAALLAGWAAAAGGGSALIPTPAATWEAFATLWSDGTFQTDLAASAERVAIGYAISIAIGVLLGVTIGTFASVEAFFEPQLGFLRYIPAPALLPLFLLLLGIDESPKIWLIVVGTVFFNVLMVADVARDVPREMLHASYTLGAGRATILRRVILPHSLPGIVDVARINLAAAWSMLVVAEILGAQAGLAYQINLSQRYRAVDVMFALLIVFGVIGLVSDLALRRLRALVAPWARS